MVLFTSEAQVKGTVLFGPHSFNRAAVADNIENGIAGIGFLPVNVIELPQDPETALSAEIH